MVDLSPETLPSWLAGLPCQEMRRGIQIAEVSLPKGTAVPSNAHIPTQAQTTASSMSSNDFNCHVGASSGGSGKNVGGARNLASRLATITRQVSKSLVRRPTAVSVGQ